MQYSISDIQVPSFMNNAAMKIFLYIVSHICICLTIPCLWDKSLVMFRLKGVFCTVNFEKYFISFGEWRQTAFSAVTQKASRIKRHVAGVGEKLSGTQSAKPPFILVAVSTLAASQNHPRNLKTCSSSNTRNSDLVNLESGLDIGISKTLKMSFSFEANG